MTEPETNYSSEVDVFSDKSAHDSETGNYRRRRLSYHHLSDVQTDNSVAKVYIANFCAFLRNKQEFLLLKSDIINKQLVNKLVEKHVREHIERRFSAGHSESEKVIKSLRLLTFYDRILKE